jgi:hypothetical protein
MLPDVVLHEVGLQSDLAHLSQVVTVPSTKEVRYISENMIAGSDSAKY